MKEWPVPLVRIDAGPGFERTPDVVMIQIYSRAGRGQEAKQ
ncbi:hypothetical protein [Arthrobacter sp. AL12]|nr:hypothetical protein [Arthrobacter sp. AL12]MDI3212692.1 hypothetical protein [Arthrobacter sp. AL12]